MLKYNLIGNAMQSLEVDLVPGTEIYCEAGKFLWKTANVEMDTRLSGGDGTEEKKGLLDKVLDTAVKMGKRALAGESLAFQYFKTKEPSGKVAFAQTIPGEIRAIDISKHKTFYVQRDGFLAAEGTVDFDIALTKRIGAGFFGGEGFILEKFTDQGILFIGSCGNMLEINPKDFGGKIQVDTGCLVGFDENIDYDVEWIGKSAGQVIKNLIFGGEGLFLATLSGDGKVLLQSMNLSRLSRSLVGAARQTSPEDRTGGNVMKGIGSILGEIGGGTNY